MTASDEHAAQFLRRRLIDTMDQHGELPPAWREAFIAVPRHAFVPDVIWCESQHGLRPLHRDDDPQTWLSMAYADREIVVQVDDGAPTGSFGRRPSSTMTSPYDMVRLLSSLAAEPGMRVCEIGTGTGYTAALLAHRLGAGAVTTVEVDAALARDSRQRLSSAGLDDVVAITGDGAHGCRERAPFDRLLATATVQRIPHAWVTQVRPGGLIVTSWGTPYHTEALLKLTVGDGGTAAGRIIGPAPCQWLRDQRVPAVLKLDERDAALSQSRYTDLNLEDIAGSADASLAIGVRVPACAGVFIPPDDQWFVDPTTGSWARLHQLPTGRNLINQFGPRSLWDEIEAAHAWWHARGRPGFDRWRVTVSRTGTSIHLTGTPGPSAAGGEAANDIEFVA